jgi:hypothetical protein
VFTGGNGSLFNLEWFNFLGGTNVIEVASYNTLSGDEFLEPSSEGAQDLGGISDGQSLMGDLIANGLTGAAGNAGEPTLNGVVGYTFVVSHYEAGYTLAESFYAGTPYIGWEQIVVGDPLLAPYYGAMSPVTPIQASSFNGSAGGVNTEDSSEGDLNLGNITNGSNTHYNSINLAGMNAFTARVASAGPGGNIQIRLDSATGTLIGTCAVPVTGDWQAWTTVTCGLTGASGTHTSTLCTPGEARACSTWNGLPFSPVSRPPVTTTYREENSWKAVVRVARTWAIS